VTARSGGVSTSELIDLEPWSVVEHLARTLQVHVADAQELVEVVSAEAVRIVPAACYAGVIITDPRRHLATVTATSSVPKRLDEVQQHVGRGPCLTAARKQIVVHMYDIATDKRWPPFCDAAAEVGVASMVCLPLYVDEQVLGTLSLYADRPEAFATDGAEPVARMLATLAALALAESHRTFQLRLALQNRDLIGQAKGILMHAHSLTADAAFLRLAQRSQHTNTKLVEVAARVVETGTLDD
jgi:GAF domain-containing protein